MTGLPQESLDKIGCPHCWHRTGTFKLTSPGESQAVCCWCGWVVWQVEKGLNEVPGHGPHYPLR